MVNLKYQKESPMKRIYELIQNKRSAFFKMAGLMALFLIGETSQVKGAPEDVALYPNDGWVWRFAPVLGPQSYSGTVRVEGVQGSASAGLDDLADRATFQMAMLAEGHGERAGFLFDLSYLALNADLVNDSGAANLSASLLSVDTLGSFGLGPWDMGTTSTGFELLGGGRWNQLNGDAQLSTGASGDAGRGWVDPVVGGRVTTGFDFPLRLELRSDWGGFGVGSATKSTWKFFGAAHFRPDPALEFFAGYRITDIQSQHISGTKGTALDGRVSGPVIGITFILD